MEETTGLHSNRKFWLLVLACIIGFALLMSALRSYPDGSITHAVLKFSGLFLLAVGASVLATELMWHEKLKMPISASVWIAVDGAEEIELKNDLDRAMLENVLRDVREYKKRNNLAYPPTLQSRITALERKLMAR